MTVLIRFILALSVWTILGSLNAQATAPLPSVKPEAIAKIKGPISPYLGQPYDFMAYLESMEGTKLYMPPSDIPDDYLTALYVNNATSGPTRQRMWVLHRDTPDSPWRLGMRDQTWWEDQQLAEGQEPWFSWLVSTGRKYKTIKFSGTTPEGVFNLDERPWRRQIGRYSPLIFDVLFLDWHYNSGRKSGVAFHGTPPREYKYFGQNESHGCIRMHQRNSRALFKRVTGMDDYWPSKEQSWGQTPRYWRTEAKWKKCSYKVRSGYSIAGRQAQGGKGPLTKTGFKTLVVLFKDAKGPSQ